MRVAVAPINVRKRDRLEVDKLEEVHSIFRADW